MEKVVWKSVEDVLRHTESGIVRPRLDVKVTGGVMFIVNPLPIQRQFWLVPGELLWVCILNTSRI